MCVQWFTCVSEFFLHFLSVYLDVTRGSCALPHMRRCCVYWVETIVIHSHHLNGFPVQKKNEPKPNKEQNRFRIFTCVCFIDGKTVNGERWKMKSFLFFNDALFIYGFILFQRKDFDPCMRGWEQKKWMSIRFVVC